MTIFVFLQSSLLDLVFKIHVSFFSFQFDSISFGSEFPKCTEMETHRVKGKAKTITIDFLFDYKGFIWI